VVFSVGEIVPGGDFMSYGGDFVIYQIWGTISVSRERFLQVRIH